MKKTIKIIDLLYKIANGEEVPKKIKYRNNIYEYEGSDYFGNDIGYLFERYNLTAILNDEVEILEEEKKLPEKLEKYYDYLDDGSNSGHYFENILKLSEHGESEITEAESLMVDKINGIIDYLESKEKGE